MEYTRLGRSGLRVARACMGTMTFGREADEATSFALLDRYLDLGGNFIDTADQYSTGGSEEVIGRWLQERGGRDRLVIATKVYSVMGPGANDGGLSRLHIQQAIEASLRRLQTDVVDVYQIHRWDPNTPPEETMRALDDLVCAGKVRYVACSNLAAFQLDQFMHLAQVNHWNHFVSIQPVYNALNRSIEVDVLPAADHWGMGVISYNPLAGGMLTGKYRPGQDLPQGARLQAFRMYYERYYTQEAIDVVEAFLAHAKDRGLTPAQLALAWVLAEPRVTCPIVGARNLEQLDDTLGGLDVALTPEERKAVPALLPGRWVGKDPVYDREF